MERNRSVLYVLFFFCLGLVLGCGNSSGFTRVQSKLLNNILEYKGEEIIEGKYCVVILPEAGCGSCISPVEEYFISNTNLKAKKTLLILNSFASLKMLKVSFGDDVDNRENVIVDSQGLFETEEFLSLYPTFIYFSESGKIQAIEYANPASPETFNNYLAFVN